MVSAYMYLQDGNIVEGEQRINLAIRHVLLRRGTADGHLHIAAVGSVPIQAVTCICALCLLLTVCKSIRHPLASLRCPGDPASEPPHLPTASAFCSLTSWQCSNRWLQLPDTGVWPQLPVLQSFQQIVELQESSRLLVDLGMGGRPDHPYGDLKARRHSLKAQRFCTGCND